MDGNGRGGEEVDCEMGGVERGTVGNPIVVDKSDGSSESGLEDEVGEEEDSDDEMEGEMEGEMESVEDDDDDGEIETQELRCRGGSVGFEAVLKHLEASLKWKMQYGIWQKS